MVRTLINFVVSSLEIIAVIGFVVAILAGIVMGAQSGGFIGAVVGLLLGTLWSVLVFGLLFLMIQNNKILKEIRDSLRAGKTI